MADRVSCLKAWRQWHRKHPKVKAVFARYSAVSAIMYDADPWGNRLGPVTTLQLEGVPIVIVPDKELPSSFQAIPGDWGKLIQDANRVLRAKAVVCMACKMLQNELG